MKIDIHGAKVHNLKDVDVSIPKEKLTVVTGLSGSGKSSLAFDTLYAEGQRRYVESLSSYARQFLGRLDKPDVDRIDGLSPAVAIEQRSASGGPRSTVATRTEIMDHLRMLFARIGVTKSPISGEVVRKDRVTDVVDHILTCGAERMMLVAPLAPGTTAARRTSFGCCSSRGTRGCGPRKAPCAWTASTGTTSWAWSSTAFPHNPPPRTKAAWRTASRRPSSKGAGAAKCGRPQRRQGRVRGIQRPLRTGRHGLP